MSRDLFTRYRATLLGSLISLVGTFPIGLCAGDWPQILGPHRNGVADGERVAPWEGDQLTAKWTFPVGTGYAGPVAVGNRVFVFHRLASSEIVEAVDALSGKPVWKTEYEASYRGGYNPDTGPRCVPVVAGERLVVFGAAGDLHCLARDTGKKLWSRDTFADFDAQEGYFGAGSSPIVLGDRVLVNVGGRKGGGVVAFSLQTGKTLWAATDEAASYSSPIEFMHGGKPCAFFVARLTAVGVDPANGKVLFSFPFGMKGPTVNAATPLAIEKRLFLTASYGIGADLKAVDGAKAVSIWANDETLSSQYSTPIFHRGFLYGNHGREDVGAAELRCVDANTGKVQWSEDRFGVAHLILAGERLLLLTVDGRLVLADANPKKFTSLATAQVSSATTRALPALAGGHLYLRDNRESRGELKCFALKAR